MKKKGTSVTLKAGLLAVVGLTSVTLGAYQDRILANGVIRHPIVREHKPVAAVEHSWQGPGHCAGGGERTASIEIVPDVFASRGNRSWVEYHADIKLNRASGAGVSWVADVVDDRGQIILKDLTKGESAVGANAARTVTTKTISAATLSDGFYTLRVRAAVSVPLEPDDVIEALQYFQVEGGKWAEITSAKWFADTRAAFATPVPAEVAK